MEENQERVCKTVDKEVILGSQGIQTRDAKWLCLENVYQKFYRPNFYDVGGTYIQDVADFWFMYKTEQVGKIFLLHLFIVTRSGGSFTVGVSCSNELNIDKKNSKVYLPTSLKEYSFQKAKEVAHLYLRTYSFSDLDVDLLKNKSLFIAVSFPVRAEKGVNQELLDNVKASHNFGALLNDPIITDFTIESADGQEFKVHRLLLSAHSEVFKAMLKEDTAESQNSHVKLVDVSTEDLGHILEFIYTGTISDLDNCNFINLLMLADQYNLTGLRELSQYMLYQQIRVENAVEILTLADMYNSEKLKIEALKVIKKNPKALQSDMFKEIKNAQLMREICEYLGPPQ